MTHVRSSSITAFVLAIVCAPPPAAAKDPAPPPPSAAQLDEARKHFEQAEAYMRVGTFDQAAAAYQAAHAVIPTPVLLFNVGLAWEQHGDLDAALAAYDRYLAAEPDGIKSVEARARRAALATKLDTARQASERTAQLSKLRARADAHRAAGQHAEEIATLRELEGLTDDPELDFALGEAYLSSGDRLRAESAYRRYLAGAGTVHRDDVAARLRDLEAGPPPVVVSKLPEIVSYSAAGTVLVVGVVFGLRARARASELETGLELARPPLDSGDERFDSGRSAALVANIAYGMTALAAGIGAYFTIRRLRSGRGTPTEHLTITPPRDAGHGAALAYEVRW